MTREQAEKKVGGNLVRAGEIVGALVSLGLLTLDEPKEPLDVVVSELGWGKYGKDLLDGILVGNNLKLVRA